jgi:hypothetical protein
MNVKWLGKLLVPIRNRSTRNRRVLSFELLEERVLLNNRYIVPADVPVDNNTTFQDMGDALSNGDNGSTLNPGDVIQIEPGSAPGSLQGGLPHVQNLTIQGDPAVDAAEIPAFEIFDTHFVVGANENGLILKNLRIDVVGGEMVFFGGNVTIDHSIVTNYVAGGAILIDGSTACVIRNSQILNYNGVNSTSVMQIVESTGAHNQITGNVFFDATGFQEGFITDEVQGPPTAVVNDLIAGNTFSARNLGGLNALIDVFGLSGVTIQNNTFEFSDTSQETAIDVERYSQNIQVIGNRIEMIGFGDVGIQVQTGPTGQVGTTTATITLNQISSGTNGTGIELSMNAASAPATALSVQIEGNVFGVNQHCVKIDSVGGSVSGIDLGGGTLLSKGANNFRGITAADGAIDVTSPAATGSISAKGNLFSVADPESVIHDHHDDSTLASVLVANSLTGNAAYVEALYLDFLHRVGDTSNLADAGAWVQALNHATPASSVAAGIIRSPEALGFVADDLYRRFLNRDAGADRAGWISFCRTAALWKLRNRCSFLRRNTASCTAPTVPSCNPFITSSSSGRPPTRRSLAGKVCFLQSGVPDSPTTLSPRPSTGAWSWGNTIFNF